MPPSTRYAQARAGDSIIHFVMSFFGCTQEQDVPQEKQTLNKVSSPSASVSNGVALGTKSSNSGHFGVANTSTYYSRTGLINELCPLPQRGVSHSDSFQTDKTALVNEYLPNNIGKSTFAARPEMHFIPKHRSTNANSSGHIDHTRDVRIEKLDSRKFSIIPVR
eukprot:CFRG7805T1